MVPADSHRISRAPWYSGTLSARSAISPTGLSPSLDDLSRSFDYCSASLLLSALQPRAAMPFGLGSSRFARHYSENNYCSLFLRVLRCFTSPSSLRRSGDGTLLPPGFPIRTFTDHCLLPAPRDISSVATSFFASLCQGIHHMLLLSYRSLIAIVPRCAFYASRIEELLLLPTGRRRLYDSIIRDLAVCFALPSYFVYMCLQRFIVVVRSFFSLILSYTRLHGCFL